jgi:hypothetical protein
MTEIVASRSVVFEKANLQKSAKTVEYKPLSGHLVIVRL